MKISKFLILLGLLLLLLVACSPSGLASADAHEDDEEDEDDSGSSIPTQESQGSETPPELTFAPVAQRTSWFPTNLKAEDFYVEFALLGFLFFYFVSYFYGGSVNRSIVNAWVQSNMALLEKNFAYFAEEGGRRFVKDGESDYIFYASGRSRCQSLTARFELRKRHDLAGLFMEYVYPVNDRVHIEVVMNDKDMDAFVFGIFQKRKFLALKEEQYDLDTFAKAIDSEVLPASLIVATESNELASLFLHKKVLPILQQHERLIESIRFSDQPKKKPLTFVDKGKKTLNFAFKLPSSASEVAKITSLLEMVIFYIDFVAENSPLKDDARSKPQKARTLVKDSFVKEEKALKLEEQQRVKAEKEKEERTKEREKEKEMLRKMTPDQQRAYEEKQHQKEVKKQQQARMKFMKV